MAKENLSERDMAVLKCIFDPTATIGEVVDDGDKFVESEAELTPSELEAKELCAKGIQLAEQGKVKEALELLNQAVKTAPKFAAAYNDRAQVLRLLKKDDAAMSDIDFALSLTSGERGRARALALCQRGLLLRGRGRDEEARAAFGEAAKMGSGFARKQVVELNPYAALCNQMLSQIIKGESDIKL